MTLKNILSITISIVFFSISPTHAFSAYRVGVNYHQTGFDIDKSTFIRQYHLPGVRELVITQLKDMVNAGTVVFNTRLWLTDPNPNSFPTVYQRLEFPLTTQSLDNIRQYTQDVSNLKTPSGKNVDLYFTFLWQGCAAYNGGYATWCNYSWDEYLYYAKYSIDQLFNTIGNINRPDGSKAVQKVYFDGEVIIEKVNTDKMLTQVYPYFVSKANASGITPTIYFMLKPDGTLDRFLSPTLDFMKANNLFIPPRIDISWYPVPGYPYEYLNTGYGALAENTFANLHKQYPEHTFAIAETFYMKDPSVRREFGLAFATVAQKYGKLEELLIWPDFDYTNENNNSVWNAPRPYDMNSYYITPITKMGDLNGDGHVNLYDYTELIRGYSTLYTDDDFINVLSNYGK